MMTIFMPVGERLRLNLTLNGHRRPPRTNRPPAQTHPPPMTLSRYPTADFNQSPATMNQPRLLLNQPADAGAYAEHLERVGSTKHAPTLDNPDAFVLGVFVGKDLIAHLAVLLQPLAHRADEPIALLELDNESFTDAYPPGLIEGFVQTFDVEEPYRRRGVGSRLQLAALEECRNRGAHQLRSWSSLDRPANYALKIALGFAAHPGHSYLPAHDRWVRGTYFVKPV